MQFCLLYSGWYAHTSSCMQFCLLYSNWSAGKIMSRRKKEKEKKGGKTGLLLIWQDWWRQSGSIKRYTKVQVFGLGALLWTDTDTTCIPWRSVMDTMLHRHKVYPLACCYGHNVTQTQSVPQAELPRGGEVKRKLQ